MTPLEDWLYQQLEKLVALEMFILMLTVSVDVGGRYLLNKPLPAGYELIQVQMGLVAFTAIPLLSRTNEHIALGLFDHLFKGWAARLQRCLIHLFSAAGMAFISSRIWAYAVQLGSMDERTPVLGFPLAPLGQFMAVMAGAGAVLLVFLALRALRQD
ncbi:MAG: TRAP transporter small permease [Betaproteobacteria bacterium]